MLRKAIVGLALIGALTACGGQDNPAAQTPAPVQEAVTPSAGPKMTAQAKTPIGSWSYGSKVVDSHWNVMLTKSSNERPVALNYNKNVAKVNVWGLNNYDRDEAWELIYYNGDGATGGYMLIRKIGTGLCLQSYLGGYNGAPVSLSDCNTDKLLERWHWDWGKIRNYGNTDRFCLDNFSREDGAGVHIWTCDPGETGPNQYWRYDPTGSLYQWGATEPL